jgi:hypothetical protein
MSKGFGFIEQGYDGVFYPAKLLTNFTKNQMSSNTYKKGVNNIAYGIDFIPRKLAQGLNTVVEAPYHIGKYVSKYYTTKTNKNTPNKNTTHKDNGRKTKNSKTVNNTIAVYDSHNAKTQTHKNPNLNPNPNPYNWLKKYKNREPVLTRAQIKKMLKHNNESNNSTPPKTQPKTRARSLSPENLKAPINRKTRSLSRPESITSIDPNQLKELGKVLQIKFNNYKDKREKELNIKDKQKLVKLVKESFLNDVKRNNKTKSAKTLKLLTKAVKNLNEAKEK